MTQSAPSGGRSRRGPALYAVLAVLIIGAAALGYYVWQQQQRDEIATAAAEQATTSESDQPSSDLMDPGPLPENVMGSEDAPVTVIEYSSMTCPHCARFHANVLPDLKKQYIDTGKVKYIIREFPLDNLAAAAFMLARCIDRDRYFPFVDVLYETQSEWARNDPNQADLLFNVAKQAGFTRESFEKCLSDQKLLDDIMAVRKRGTDTFKVSSTPTFFVNGKLLKGVSSVADFEKAMPADVVNKAD